MELTIKRIKPTIYLGLKFLMICLTALFAVDTVWSLIEPPNTKPNTEISTLKKGDLTNQHSIDFNQLISSDLFGTSDNTRRENPDYSKPATKTQLPLTLLSVFASESKDRSAAIISQRDQTPKKYKIKDTLPGNATLIEILKDKVIFIRAGNREELAFPEIKGAFEALKTAQRERSDLLSENVAATQKPVLVSESSQGPSGRFPSSVRERQTDSENKSSRLKNIEAVVEARGNLSFNKQGGIIVDESINNTYLKQTGLQQGDIILSVNGKPTNQIGRNKEMIQTLMTEGSARIEVQRGSRRFVITASIPR